MIDVELCCLAEAVPEYSRAASPTQSYQENGQIRDGCHNKIFQS